MQVAARDAEDNFNDDVENVDKVLLVSGIFREKCCLGATQPIVKAWVFGSYARGEAHSGSDIDILVVFDKEAKVSLMRHAKISLELSELLGFDVDLITEGTLLSFAERTANNDRILIYDRDSRDYLAEM